MREKIIDIYYEYRGEDQNGKPIGNIRRIILPDDKELHFDEEQGQIDLKPLRGWIGNRIVFHELNQVRFGTLCNVGPMEIEQADGEVKLVNALHIEWDDDNGKEE